jgi:hypothetical protein
MPFCTQSPSGPPPLPTIPARRRCHRSVAVVSLALHIHQSDAQGVPHRCARHDLETTEQSEKANVQCGNKDVSVMMQRDSLSWRVCSEKRRGANVCSMRPAFSSTQTRCYQPHSHHSTRTCFVAYLNLIVHPGGDPVSSETRCKPQACRAHGKV